MKFRFIFLVLLPFVAAAKKEKGENPAPTTSPAPLFRNLSCPLLKDRACSSADLNFCVGLRGNGYRFWAHFPAMARMVETLGPVSGAAAASGAAYATFVLESIQKNPYVRQCGQVSCTLRQQKARISFLLKAVEPIGEFLSLVGAFEYFIGALGDDIAELVQAVQAEDQETDALVGLAVALLDPASTLAGLLNPDFVSMILGDLWNNQEALLFHITDTFDRLLNLFGAELTFLDFVRPIPLSFRGLVNKVDYLASFMAGYAPVDVARFNKLLDECATPNIVFGNRWNGDIGRQLNDEAVSCEQQLKKLYLDFTQARNALHPRRENDRIGDVFPNIVPTSVVTGETFELWKQTAAQYLADPFDVTLPNPNYDDVRFGSIR